MRYLIKTTRRFLPGTITATPEHECLGRHNVDGEIATYGRFFPAFGSHAECVAAINALNSETYLPGHGEYTRPDYRAVPETLWPDYITGV